MGGSAPCTGEAKNGQNRGTRNQNNNWDWGSSSVLMGRGTSAKRVRRAGGWWLREVNRTRVKLLGLSKDLGGGGVRVF